MGCDRKQRLMELGVDRLADALLEWHIETMRQTIWLNG